LSICFRKVVVKIAANVEYLLRQGIHCCVRPQPLLNKGIKVQDYNKKRNRVPSAGTAADNEPQPIVEGS